MRGPVVSGATVFNLISIYSFEQRSKDSLSHRSKCAAEPVDIPLR
jgi:hypothetical protein